MGKSAADKEMDYNYSKLNSDNAQSNLNRELQKYLQSTQQNYDSSQSQLNREFQSSESTKGREFQGSESEKGRELQKYLQQAQNQFTGSESDKSRELQKYLQQAQNQFTGSESEKARAFEQGLINQKVGLNKGYEDLGAQEQSQGEAQFLNSSSEENPFLKSYMDAYLKNALPEQQRQLNQVNANLATQGVRGGQAATLANRASGDLNNQLYSNLNQLQFNDAQQKQNQRAQYFASKANAGQSRKLNPAFGV